MIRINRDLSPNRPAAGAGGKAAPVDLDCDLAAMGLEEIRAYRARVEAWRDELDRARADIGIDLETARAIARANQGVFEDPEWYARARTAWSYKDHAVRQINRRLNEIDRKTRPLQVEANVSRAEAEQKARPPGQNKRFVAAAKRLLDRETIELIWAAAREADPGKSAG